MKRKADAPADKAASKFSNRTPPNKKQKPDFAGGKGAKGKFTDNQKPDQKPKPVSNRPAFKSVLQTEEKAFPRGGASVLTPLEHKQIQNKATRDVLFEQSGNKGKKKKFEESDDSDYGAEDQKAAKKKERKNKVDRRRKDRIDDEERAKLEGWKKNDYKPSQSKGKKPAKKQPSASDALRAAAAGDLMFASQVKVDDILPVVVNRIAQKGIFVELGPNLLAFVMVTDLSDKFVKEWESLYKVGQELKGRVIRVDKEKEQVQMSLKESMLDPNWSPPVTFDDLALGQVYTAKVKKVESFGVFIAIDNSKNISGLCHRSEIADSKVQDVKKLYEVGDAVKAIVLNIESDKNRVNFGLKASYFKSISDNGLEEAEEDDDTINPGVGDLTLDSDDDLNIFDINNPVDNTDSSDDEDLKINVKEKPSKPKKALATNGFDWEGGLSKPGGVPDEADMSDTENDKKKKKKKKPEIQVDKTGELDKYGPRAVADFERLLLGQPNSSATWIQYMAFQLGLNEVDKARAVAERALKTINMREEDEKHNIWIALLNLENTYGSDESLEEVFQRSCSFNDKTEMHARLASIFIESGKLDKADLLFSKMTSLKDLTATPAFWVNYATFLMTSKQVPDSARALLLRATQSVPAHDHRLLTAKFGSLEFTSPNGDTERGRTVFEGLLSTWPKRWDIWDMYLDLEKAHGNDDNVRSLWERMSKTKMKKRRAKFVFKKWLDWEEEYGTSKDVEKVKATAADYVRKLASMDEGDDAEE